jgi:hypothetical protein
MRFNPGAVGQVSSTGGNEIFKNNEQEINASIIAWNRKCYKDLHFKGIQKT